MKKHNYTEQLMATINITPFVDVMLVLLAIFMITAPLIVTGVKVQLPNTAAHALVKNKQKPIVLTITKQGKVYLFKTHTTKLKLIQQLRVIQKKNPTTTIYIRGDSKASYGTVMSVMSTLNQAGITHIALITDPSQKNR